MALEAIRKNLQAAIKDGSLVTSGRIPEESGFPELLATIFGQRSIVVGAPVITLEEGLLVLAGNTEFGRLGPVTIRITLQDAAGQLQPDVVLQLPELLKLDMPQFMVGGFRLSLARFHSGELDGGLSARITLFGQQQIDVRLALPISSTGVTIALAAASLRPIPDLRTLADWMGVADLAALLPEGVGKVDELFLQNFSVQFNPRDRSIDHLACCLAFSRFTLLPGLFTLRDVRLVLALHRPLSPAAFSLNSSLYGVLELQGITIPVLIAYDSASGAGELQLGDDAGAQLPSLIELLTLVCGRDALSSIPEQLRQLGAVRLSKLGLSFNLKTAKIDAVYVEVALDKWTLIDGSLSLAEVFFFVAVSDPQDSNKRTFSGGLSGLVRIGRVELALSASYARELSFKGGLPKLALSDIARQYMDGVTFPEFLPDLVLSNLAVSLAPATGVFAVEGTATATWTIAGKQVEVQLGLKLAKGAAPAQAGSGVPLSCSVHAAIRTKLEIMDGFALDNLDVTFSYEATAGKWLLKGKLGTQLFDNPVEFSAGYEREKKAHSISLATEGALTLVDMADVAKLSIAAFAIDLKKSADGTYDWTFDLASELKLVDLLAIDGRLKLLKQGAKYRLELHTSEKSQLSISLLKAPAITVTLTAPQLTLGRTGGPKPGWELIGSSKLGSSGIKQLPFFQPWLPEQSEVSLSITSAGIVVKTARLTDRIPVTLPDLQIDGVKIELSHLGTLYMELVDVDFSLTRNPRFTVTLGVGLPRDINKLFGVDDQGKEKLRIFKTYRDDDPAKSMARLKFGIGFVPGDLPGIVFELVDSPFHALDITDKVWHCDMGEYGAVDITVPTFRLTGKSFAASGGFKVTKDLSLPLTPLIELLKRLGASAFASQLPRKLSLMEIKVFENEELQTQKLISLLEPLLRDAGIREFPPAIATLLGKLAAVGRKLPKDLKEYFNFALPRDFSYDIALNATGGFNLDVQTKQVPIRALYPTIMMGIPSLQGMTLRGFSLGSMFGGALWTLRFDGIFDQFDLPRLVAGLLIEDNDYLTPSTQVQHRITVNDFWMLIAIVKGIPVPVPLFYKHLGIDILGLEGIMLKGHIEFPMPTFDLGEFVRTFSALKDFVTKPEARLLGRGALPEKITVRFVWRDTLIRLPKYMGSHQLGTTGPILTFDLLHTTAAVLDAIKFGSTREIVQLVKLSQRHGSSDVAFFGMRMQAKWLLTTPEEFRDESHRAIEIPPTLVRQYLTLIPRQGDYNGLVVYLDGKWHVPSICTLSASFALCLVGLSRFATQLRFEGMLFERLRLELTAEVQFTENPTSLYLAGLTRISWQTLEIFRSAATIRVDADKFTLAGVLRLFPEGSPLRLAADVNGHIGRASFTLEGSGSACLLVDNLIALSRAKISSQGVELSLALFGINWGWVVVQNDASRFTLSLSTNALGLFSFAPTLTLEHSGQGGAFTFNGGLGGDLLVFDGRTSVGNGVSGTFNLSVLRMPVLSNQRIAIGSAGLSISGQARIDVPHLIDFTANIIEGSIGSHGVTLAAEGSLQVSILPRASARLRLRNGSLTIGFNAELISGGIASFRHWGGSDAFLVGSYLGTIFGNVKTSIVLYLNPPRLPEIGIGFSWREDWPQDLKPDEMAASTSTTLPDLNQDRQEMVDPPQVLAAVQQLLGIDWLNPLAAALADADWQRLMHVGRDYPLQLKGRSGNRDATEPEQWIEIRLFRTGGQQALFARLNDILRDFGNPVVTQASALVFSVPFRAGPASVITLQVHHDRGDGRTVAAPEPFEFVVDLSSYERFLAAVSQAVRSNPRVR